MSQWNSRVLYEAQLSITAQYEVHGWKPLAIINWLSADTVQTEYVGTSQQL